VAAGETQPGRLSGKGGVGDGPTYPEGAAERFHIKAEGQNFSA